MEHKDFCFDGAFVQLRQKTYEEDHLSYGVVQCWYYNSIQIVGHISSTPYESVEPVNITEEILKKIGFKWMNHKLFFDGISIFEMGAYFVSEGRFYFELKYVHELQWLYKIVFKKELPIQNLLKPSN